MDDIRFAKAIRHYEKLSDAIRAAIVETVRALKIEDQDPLLCTRKESAVIVITALVEQAWLIADAAGLPLTTITKAISEIGDRQS